MQEFSDFVKDAGGNDDNTLGVRRDWNEVAWMKG